MAAIDYGAILKINGEQINTEMFMKRPEWVPEVIDTDCGPILTDGYFVYAGDKDFFLCFYKCVALVVSKGREIYAFTAYYDHAQEETRFFDECDVTVKHIDKKLQNIYCEKWSYEKQDYIKSHRVAGKSRTNKYLATWDYKGNHYEVVYGYGIDPNKKVYEDIKYRYEYTDTERQFLEAFYG